MVWVNNCHFLCKYLRKKSNSHVISICCFSLLTIFFFSRVVLRSFFWQFLAEAFSEPSLSCIQYNEGKISDSYLIRLENKILSLDFKQMGRSYTISSYLWPFIIVFSGWINEAQSRFFSTCFEVSRNNRGRS